MRKTSRLATSYIFPTCVAALLSVVPAAAQAKEAISATATVKSSGGVTSTAPLSITVDRFSTDAERDELMAALKKSGTEGVRRLLLTRQPIGTLKVGNESTAIKYIYARTTPDGRLITAVTGSPIAYVGAAAPGAKARTGFDLGLVLLELTASKPGHGELVPATKVRLNEQGAVVTEDYSGDTVQLSNVIGK